MTDETRIFSPKVVKNPCLIHQIRVLYITIHQINHRCVSPFSI